MDFLPHNFVFEYEAYMAYYPVLRDLDTMFLMHTPQCSVSQFCGQ